MSKSQASEMAGYCTKKFEEYQAVDGYESGVGYWKAAECVESNDSVTV